jgi:hypothetical protein
MPIVPLRRMNRNVGAACGGANAELSLRSHCLAVAAAGGSNQSFETDWLLALRS